MERLTKRLHQMKLLLYGDGEKETDKEKALVRARLLSVCLPRSPLNSRMHTDCATTHPPLTRSWPSTSSATT